MRGAGVDLVPGHLGEGRGQAGPVETDHDRGDVVRPTGGVRPVDQGIASRLEGVGGPEALRDLRAADLSREAIRADDQHVTSLDALHREIHLDARLGAQRLEDDVPPFGDLGLFGRELTGVDEPLHQRLVLGDLRGEATAHQVRTRVPHLTEIQRVAEEAREGDRGPHPLGIGVRGGVGVDPLIRAFGGEAERLCEVIRVGGRGLGPLRPDLLEDHGARHPAGELPRRGAAHPIGDHEEGPAFADGAARPDDPLSLLRDRLRRLRCGEIGDEEGVLVVLPPSPHIGTADHLDRDSGRGNRSRHGFSHPKSSMARVARLIRGRSLCRARTWRAARQTPTSSSSLVYASICT